MDLLAEEGTTCPEGECDADGICQSTCIPCGEKNCGSDGCGSSCGVCGPGNVCDNGTCAPVCGCGTRVCGVDVCGQSCGQCPSGSSCSPSGQCQPTGCTHSPCDVGAPLVNGCSACATSVCALYSACCATSWDPICVALASTVCTTPTCCVPDCLGRACGSDGCGGKCGACSAPDACDLSGQCAPPAPCGHDVCTIGAGLASECDPCVTAVCAVDDMCCNDQWDDICVDQANELCGADCCVPNCSDKDCG